MLDLPDNIPAPGAWSEFAACKNQPIELFYPKSGRRPTRALAICGTCDVKSECLEYALEHHQHWGVWGDMTERQRFEEKRQRRQLEHEKAPDLSRGLPSPEGVLAMRLQADAHHSGSESFDVTTSLSDA